jgi:hypothetical protein
LVGAISFAEIVIAERKLFVGTKICVMYFVVGFDEIPSCRGCVLRLPERRILLEFGCKIVSLVLDG